MNGPATVRVQLADPVLTPMGIDRARSGGFG